MDFKASQFVGSLPMTRPPHHCGKCTDSPAFFHEKFHLVFIVTDHIHRVQMGSHYQRRYPTPGDSI